MAKKNSILLKWEGVSSKESNSEMDKPQVGLSWSVSSFEVILSFGVSYLVDWFVTCTLQKFACQKVVLSYFGIFNGENTLFTKSALKMV